MYKIHRTIIFLSIAIALLIIPLGIFKYHEIASLHASFPILPYEKNGKIYLTNHSDQAKKFQVYLPDEVVNQSIEESETKLLKYNSEYWLRIESSFIRVRHTPYLGIKTRIVICVFLLGLGSTALIALLKMLNNYFSEFENTLNEMAKTKLAQIKEFDKNGKSTSKYITLESNIKKQIDRIKKLNKINFGSSLGAKLSILTLSDFNEWNLSNKRLFFKKHKNKIRIYLLIY